MDVFNPLELKNLWTPEANSNGEDNGQITIIGGSSLFHGAPVFALKAASRIVDMVFFASPEKPLEKVATKLMSSLSSFIWVPWADVEDYIKKSDAILIGPGFMRFESEKVSAGIRQEDCDEACQISKNTTKDLLKKFPNKKWVIDAGSLQTMDASWIPNNAILTPNAKEFTYLFGGQVSPQEAAEKFNCTVVVKGPVTVVCSPDRCEEIHGGNPGLTKGGTGDTQAGLTTALFAKNDAFLSAAAASYVIKKTGDVLHGKMGTMFNADDLAEKVSEVFFDLL